MGASWMCRNLKYAVIDKIYIRYIDILFRIIFYGALYGFDKSRTVSHANPMNKAIITGVTAGVMVLGLVFSPLFNSSIFASAQARIEGAYLPSKA